MKTSTVTARSNLQFFSPLLESLWRSLSLVKRSRRGLIGFVVLLGFIGMAAVGPLIIPLDLSINLSRAYLPMSSDHLFGTDQGGRDVFSLVVYGSRQVLLVAFLAGFFTVSVGVAIGLISGLKEGKMDDALMLISDFALTIPGVPLILVLVSIIGYGRTTNPLLLAGILSITAWASLARSIRSQVLSLKEREFVEAAKTLGLSTFHILFRELLPNITYYVAINFLYAMVGAIYALIGLFFLGLLPFDVTNWGIILYNAQYYGVVFKEGLLTKGTLIGPILSIVLLQTGLVLLCSGLEEIFNPRLRTD